MIDTTFFNHKIYKRDFASKEGQRYWFGDDDSMYWEIARSEALALVLHGGCSWRYHDGEIYVTSNVSFIYN